jgi:hypothetical protein
MSGTIEHILKLWPIGMRGRLSMIEQVPFSEQTSGEDLRLFLALCHWGTKNVRGQVSTLGISGW